MGAKEIKKRAFVGLVTTTTETLFANAASRFGSI
jgi:hypothetical protein